MAAATVKRPVSAKRAASRHAAAGMSDATVAQATGKTWAQWVAALDKAGARKLPHKDIVQLAHAGFGLPGWWSQMVTVEYERVTGRREMYEQAAGYSLSASRTVAVPVAGLFAAWQDTRRGAQWLPEPVTPRKAALHKSMRVAWKDGKTILAVGFYPKGAVKAQVAVEHGKLKSKAEAERTQAAWRKRLDRLKAMLES